jgi:hypothetical protein
MPIEPKNMSVRMKLWGIWLARTKKSRRWSCSGVEGVASERSPMQAVTRGVMKSPPRSDGDGLSENFWG